MKPKFRVILEQAIEDGVRRGFHRAHKHVNKPSDENICDEITNAVMSSIMEYFTFEDSDFP